MTLRGAETGTWLACLAVNTSYVPVFRPTFEQICTHPFITLTAVGVPIIQSTRANPSSSSSSDDRDSVVTRVDMRNSNAGKRLTS
jgi:hypothetical protein